MVVQVLLQGDGAHHVPSTAEQGHQHGVVVMADFVQSDEAQLDPIPVVVGHQREVVVLVQDCGAAAEQSYHLKVVVVGVLVEADGSTAWPI